MSYGLYFLTIGSHTCARDCGPFVSVRYTSISGAGAYAYPEVGSHSVMIRLCKFCIASGILPTQSKTAQSPSGTSYSSSSSGQGAFVATAI